MDGTSQFRTSRAMLITAIVVFVVLAGLLLFPAGPARSQAARSANAIGNLSGGTAEPSPDDLAAIPDAATHPDRLTESPRGIQLTSRSEILSSNETQFADGQHLSAASISVEPLTVNPITVRFEDAAPNSDLSRLCEKMEELVSRQRQMTERQSESQENFLRHQADQAERSRAEQMFALQAGQLTAMQERIHHLDSILSELRHEALTARPAATGSPPGEGTGSAGPPFIAQESSLPGETSEFLTDAEQPQSEPNSETGVTGPGFSPDGTPLCEIIPGRSARSAERFQGTRTPSRATLPIPQGRQFGNQARIGQGPGNPPRKQPLRIPEGPSLTVEDDLALPDVPMDLTPPAQPPVAREFPQAPPEEQRPADEQGASVGSGKVHMVYQHTYRFPAQTARRPETEQPSGLSSPSEQNLLRVNHEGRAGSPLPSTSESSTGRLQRHGPPRTTERSARSQTQSLPRGGVPSGESPKSGRPASGANRTSARSGSGQSQPTPRPSGALRRPGPAHRPGREPHASEAAEDLGTAQILHRLRSAFQYAGRQVAVE